MSTFACSSTILAVSCLTLAGCSVLPHSGPDDRAIVSNATIQVSSSTDLALRYAIIDLSPSIVTLLADRSPDSMVGLGRGPSSPPVIRIGIGDVVQVTVFESAAGGLFIPAESGARPGNFVTFPSQSVDERGAITVPYAGVIQAAGRAPADVQAEIEARLAERAIEPQAVVAVIEQSAAQVTVNGEVLAPKLVVVRQSGDRLLDVIAEAGGISAPGHDTYVTLQRDGRKATVAFQTLVQVPQENIFVAPHDSIYVFSEERSFLAFGATGLNGQFNFEQEDLSLAEAVALAGGLLDDRADPRQVFLYRLMNRSDLENAGVDVSGIRTGQAMIPTIFRANFRDPTSLFMAQEFPMRDKDILYVSNADEIELFKFLVLVNGVSSTAEGVSRAVISGREALRGSR